MLRLQHVWVLLMVLALGSFAWAQSQQNNKDWDKSDQNKAEQSNSEQKSEQNEAQESKSEEKAEHNQAKESKSEEKAENNQAKEGKVEERLENATNVLQEMTGPQANAGIPDAVLHGANCIAIVPGMVKGAFIVGGRHGAGVATCRTQNAWSAPAFFQVTGASFGPQIGGQKTDLIMMVMNDQGMRQLLSGKFKLGAGASVAAGPVGREAAASGGWKAAILTYSRSKGAFAGANVKGAEIQQDNSATQKFYGKQVGFEQILSGKVEAPPQARTFLDAVQHAETVAAK